MKTTYSLNRRNAARGDHFSRIGDRFTASFVTADQIDLRPAVIAAHRLGIESSRLRIVVFLRTFRTHRKFLHAGPFSVIRQRIQDRQPRPTAGTIDKRMQIASVVRIIQLLFAFITNGNIRWNKDFSLCLFTFYNLKPIEFRVIIKMFNIYLQNSRTLRRSFLQILKEAIHLCFRPLCKNLHIRPFVADASVNVIFNRMPTHCRTKPNALHNAVNTNLSCLCLIHQHAPLLKTYKKL